MNPLARLLDQRTPNERSVIYAIGAVAAVALLAAFVWLPVERSRTRLRAELPALRASLAALERQGEEAKRLKSMPAYARNANEPLAGRPLAGAQVTLVDARTISLSAQDVAFGALLEWIAATQGSQGLRVETARIEALPSPGRVRADLRLSRP